MSDYLRFVEKTITTLIERQAARLGGKADGALCLTVTHPVYKSYLSLGHQEGGKFTTYWFPEQPMDMNPTRLDLELWPILDLLSEITGERRFHDMVTVMAEAFARHGFDPRCGLGYLAEECDFDVVGLKPLPRGSHHTPKFKPRNTGNCPTLPLDRLWRHAPGQTARMFRAMFYGLVTDPATMDFNRFCFYDFDDRDRKPSLRQDPANCAFDTAAARMIHWWSSAFARTGDAECLDWAQRMTDKWAAVQHPDSGLIPNFFGAIASNPGAPMPPGEWAETRSAALTAVSWLDAVAELSQRREGRALAAQLTDMASRLARGVARFAYDPEQRIFREHLQLDGRPYRSAARYTFHTQAEKDAAVKLQPDLAGVSVYEGAGFYRRPSYWSHCLGTAIPYELAQAAARTGDADLLGRVGVFMETAMDESRALTGEFGDEDGWTFWASAQYIKTLLVLHGATGNGQCLDQARSLADMELRFLASVQDRDRWRLPERNALLDALLSLHKKLASNQSSVRCSPTNSPSRRG